MIGIPIRTAAVAVAVLAGLAMSGAYSTAEAELLLVSAPTINPDSGSTLAASVNFSFSGNELTVILTNTSTDDTRRPSDVLTAVFFSIFGDPIGGDPSTAVLTTGSMAINATTLLQEGPDGVWVWCGKRKLLK